MTARRGRSLERLVEQFETALSDTADVNVTSPAYLPDVASGQQREIDVLIESSVGSAPVRVMIECRDRAKVQDVRWIEEISGKKQSVGADVAIAVASGGFSEPAIKKAQSLGVLVRNLEDVSIDEIRSWFAVQDLHIIRTNSKLIAATFSPTLEDKKRILQEIKDRSIDSPVLQGIKLTDEVFLDRGTGDYVSISDIAHSARKQFQLDAQTPTDGNRHQRDLTISLSENDIVLPGTPYGDVRLSAIVAKMDFWCTVTLVPVAKILQYSDPDRPILQSVQFQRFEIPRFGQVQLALTRDTASSKVHLDLRKIEDDPPLK